MSRQTIYGHELLVLADGYSILSEGIRCDFSTPGRMMMIMIMMINNVFSEFSCLILGASMENI